MKSICKASTNWIDGFYCFNFSTLLHICVKNWRQKKLRFHAPIPFSWDIKSILIPERKRGKKREMMLSLLALYSLKNKKKIFFLHFTLHHFLLSVCANGKKKIWRHISRNRVTPNKMKRHFISFANYNVIKQNLIIIAFIEQGLLKLVKKSSILSDDPRIVFIIWDYLWLPKSQWM